MTARAALVSVAAAVYVQTSVDDVFVVATVAVFQSPTVLALSMGSFVPFHYGHSHRV